MTKWIIIFSMQCPKCFSGCWIVPRRGCFLWRCPRKGLPNGCFTAVSIVEATYWLCGLFNFGSLLKILLRYISLVPRPVYSSKIGGPENETRVAVRLVLTEESMNTGRLVLLEGYTVIFYCIEAKGFIYYPPPLRYVITKWPKMFNIHTFKFFTAQKSVMLHFTA